MKNRIQIQVEIEHGVHDSDLEAVLKITGPDDHGAREFR